MSKKPLVEFCGIVLVSVIELRVRVLNEIYKGAWRDTMRWMGNPNVPHELGIMWRERIRTFSIRFIIAQESRGSVIIG